MHGRGNLFLTFAKKTSMIAAILIVQMTALVYGAEEDPAAMNGPSAHEKVAKLLSDLDVWVLPQPKSAAATGGAFDLAQCRGVRLVGEAEKIDALVNDFPVLFQERSGVSLPKNTPTFRQYHCAMPEKVRYTEGTSRGFPRRICAAEQWMRRDQSYKALATEGYT